MATLNYSAPPIPPRPYSAAGRENSRPPPIPPLPPAYQHNEEPLAAPRPQRLNPDLPADMARTLDDQLAYNGPRLSTPQPPPGPGPYNNGINRTPGFAFPGAPQPPPYYGSPPAVSPGMPMMPMPQIRTDDGTQLAGAMSGLSLNRAQPPRQRAVSSYGLPVPYQEHGGHRGRTPSISSPPPNFNSAAAFTSPSSPQPAPFPGTLSPRVSAGSPSLTAPLPTIPSLQGSLHAVQAPTADVGSKVAWIRDVLLLVNRQAASTEPHRSPTSIDPTHGPVQILDPALERLTDAALPLLISLAPGLPAQGQALSAPLAEALHIRASLIASGAFPTHLAQNQRNAFREFEAAARSGHSPSSWFRIGRDYESFGDIAHSVDCFDRGARAGDESCLYRLGMANLLGQLGLPQDIAKALPILHRAATLATISVPQPAYTYALILLGDLSSSALPLTVPIPPQLISPLIPGGSTVLLEGRKHLERAAYLHFTPAQYKLGHSYEFAEPPFPFDALLSVQYYSLASQAGEAEADLALSRWFLCGSDAPSAANGVVTNAAEGFKRDENLAFVFGEKAAKKGLPSAEFAMGYYWEVGVGVPAPDIQRAISWYERAANHGNNDAVQRLTALKSSAQALTRQEHEAITENKLVRKRTQAKARSDASGVQAPAFQGTKDATQVVDGIRKNSQMQNQTRQSHHPRHSSLAAMAPQQNTPPPGQFSSPPPPIQQVSNQGLVPQMPNHAPGPQDLQQRRQDRPRYSLVDPGFASPSPPPASGSRVGAGRGAGGRMVSGGYQQGSPKPENVPLPGGSPAPSLSVSQASKPTSPPAGGGGTKYNTFADMGVTAGKAEDKDCVIM